MMGTRIGTTFFLPRILGAVLVVFYGFFSWQCASNRGGMGERGGEPISENRPHMGSALSDIVSSDFEAMSTAQMGGAVKMSGLPSAAYSLRMMKDSVVWFSVRAIGFEVFRAMFTKTEVQLMDRFNQEYFQGGYDDFSRISEVLLSYELIESLVLNESLPYGFELTAFEIDQVKKEAHIESRRDEIGCTVMDRFPFKSPDAMKIYDLVSSRMIDVYNIDYKYFTNNILFPYIRSYFVYSGGSRQAEIQIKTSRIETNVDVNMPFQVPSTYSSMF